MAVYSYRDATTHVLLAWGGTPTYAEATALIQQEAAGFNLTPGQWQWTGTAWVAYTPPPGPDVANFTLDLMAIYGNSPIQINAMMQKYPSFDSFLQRQNWPMLQPLIEHAVSVGDLTSAQYGEIKQAWATRHIPLPAPWNQ